jgi:hypothetical protein
MEEMLKYLFHQKLMGKLKPKLKKNLKVITSPVDQNLKMLGVIVGCSSMENYLE